MGDPYFGNRCDLPMLHRDELGAAFWGGRQEGGAISDDLGAYAAAGGSVPVSGGSLGACEYSEPGFWGGDEG